MVFSSLPFIYFLFPAVFVLYFVWRNRVWRNAVLLCASLFFYAWGEPKFLPVLLLAATEAYAGGLLMARFRSAGKAKRETTAFVVTVVLLLANLFVFKYLSFAVANLNLLFGGAFFFVPEIALPIGISFYTFQILSYVIDLRRGRVAVQRNWFYLTLYVSFFPQLIAGPIVRYQTVEREIAERRETLADAAAGLERFIVGLAKKAILANGVAKIAEMVYAGDPAVYGSAMYWVAAVAYTLQIYFDFSGYSDMAIGLGRMFGFHFLENFDYPYTALSVTEFWRRWHISLSSWFRDYVYIPLGGNRVSRGRWVFNILVVWALTGFWHGAQWNFLLWGLYYAALLLLEKLVWGGALARLPKALRWIYTMFFVVLGWVLFNLTDFSQMAAAVARMFAFRPTDWLGVVAANAAVLRGLVYLPLGIVCMLPIAKRVRLPVWASRLLHLALAGVCVVYLVSSSYNPFIYFRF